MQLCGSKISILSLTLSTFIALVLSQKYERCPSNSHFRRTRESECCRYGQKNILLWARFWEDGFVEVNYHLFYIHRILGELTLGSAQGKLFDPRKKLAFWNSVPDNTLGARNYSCCSWNSVRAVPRVTSLWWPPGPRAVSKLLNWWYMQQHNLRELAVFSQNVFFQLSKYLPISRKTRMMFMTPKCKQVSCFLTDLYDRGRM